MTFQEKRRVSIRVRHVDVDYDVPCEVVNVKIPHPDGVGNFEIWSANVNADWPNDWCVL